MQKRRKRIKPGETVPLRLSDRERLLILNETLLDAPEILEKVRLAIIEQGKVVLRFTLEELEELAEHVAAAANHAENEALERELDRLYDLIEGLLDTGTDQEADEDVFDSFPTDPSDPLSALREFVRQTVGDKEFGSLEEAQEYVSKAMEEYNRRPQQEMGGLSPVQVRRLLLSEWRDERGAIFLNTALSTADLESAMIFAHARTFLAAVHQSNGVKATSKGNLNRKFVEEMVNAMDWPAGFVDDLWKYNKVLNELDVGPVHVLRLVLTMAGLLRRTKGIFKTTNRGKELLKEERAGELYGLLFSTYFRKLNLSYMSFGPEAPAVQHTIAFSLYMLSKHADDWIKLETLAPFLLLPAARGQLYQPGRSDTGIYFNSLVCYRVIQPLESFGLLELREFGKPGIPQNFEVRKTGLFDKFIRFHLTENPDYI